MIRIKFKEKIALTNSNPLFSTKHLAFLIPLLILSTSCESATEETIGGDVVKGPEGAQIVASNKQRLISPNVSPNHLEELRKGNSEFAFDLYREIKGDFQENENLFYSPFSVSIALAMTYGGANSETANQMATALNFRLSQEDLHPTFNQVDLELASRGKDAKGSDGKELRLNIINSIWGQAGYTFLPEFLDLLMLHYGSGLFLLDFQNETEQSRKIINDWIAQQTEDRIKEIFPEGSLSILTRFVLTNAIYFNGAWRNPFDEKDNIDGTFKRLDGQDVSVPMMQQRKSYGYAQDTDWQAVALPYSAPELAMLLILPSKGKFAEFENNLTALEFDLIVGALSAHLTKVTMPKFSFSSKFSLPNSLKALGMVDAFLPGAADFSGIDGTKNLHIMKVVHQAFIDVNERGTEAAAATGVGGGITSVPPTAEITLDRPFLFIIWDRPTGTILFVGRVVDPPL